MKSKATTVTQYLAEVPAERRAALKAVRALVKQHLPKGYTEGVAWGAITWSVPLKAYPDTYNGQPLVYVALGNQKNYMALYLMCAYSSKPLREKLEKAYKAAGKRLDMGMSCLRFKSLDDLIVEPITDIIAAVPMKAYIEFAKRAHPRKKT